MQLLEELVVDICLGLAGLMLGVALSLSTCVKEESCCAVQPTAQKTQAAD